MRTNLKTLALLAVGAGISIAGWSLQPEAAVAQGMAPIGTANCSSATASCVVASVTSSGAVSGTTGAFSGTITSTKTSGTGLDVSSVITGGSAVQLSNGSGVNFSLADSDAYLSRTASNTIRQGTGTAGTFKVFQSWAVGNIVVGSDGNIAFSGTAPTVSSGFGTTPSITAGTSTSFRLNVGTGGSASSGVIGLPTAGTGWNCHCADLTTQSSTVFLCKQTASSTTTATIGNFDAAGAAAAWVASDVLAINCTAL